ncbi:EF hand family protein [Tritrichomonas foetus]|uniref:EF hand family protein n=1 Tax=Tritrichomonas foetus TaxID=1144522 RepID=A0A1J4K5E1_9EUKA|nr:EF hand family protein [Tritrichomonas foetus]|eukprot:OHT06088.1 EF hand family protein [Tritrichomonas foetus]
MSRYSPEQIQHFRERFDLLDISKTGKIDRQTMAEILSYEGEQLERLMIALLFEKYDINHDGFIQYEEFETFCKSIHDLSEIDILKQIFDLADSDHSGALDIDEVVRIGQMMGLKVTNADAWATIIALDRDGNNSIDFDEFCQIIRQCQ